MVERLLQQLGNIVTGLRNLVEQADLLQILRRDRERDGVADGLVEAVIGAVLEQERLVFVGALVEVVPEFVVDGDEIRRRESGCTS